MITILLATVFSLGQPEVQRPQVVCEEIAHELNNQFVDGYISRDRATAIIDRCYDMFK